MYLEGHATDVLLGKVMISRRDFCLAGGFVGVGAALAPRVLFAAPGERFAGLPEALAQLEKDCGGRLGVAVLDTGSGESSGHRSGERFAMCSTFKMLLAASVLERVDAGKESLDRKVAIPVVVSLGNSPITKEHVGGSMTVSELCAATLMVSDNTGANLLLATIGGPEGITHFARSLGDNITRLDRVETALNEALPGDPRDTTSPEAMVADWRKLLLGDTLSPSSRKQLTDWLIANKTGEERLRAGLRRSWVVGDKTGSNGENTSNDVAIVWPEKQSPVLVAAYLTFCPGPEEKRGAALAQVGRLVAKSLQRA